jgi:outer membrane biosynthesis protein TonB
VSLLPAGVATAAGQTTTSPRLRLGGVPATPLVAVGGGEVVLEVTVGAQGRVTEIRQIRATPPYTGLVSDAVLTWLFEPATIAVEGRTVPVAAQVLVAAVFRPPSLYGGMTAGTPPNTAGAPSRRLPALESMTMPAYPPTSVGDGVVAIEIEMTARAQPVAYRILGPTSGFDDAALDAVRDWRFTAPPGPDVSERVMVYALLGFRTPVATLSR